MAPLLTPKSPLECALRGTRNNTAIATMIPFAWIPAIMCRIKTLQFENRMCRRGNRDATIDLAFSPGDWIRAHPAIAAAVTWERAGGTVVPYDRWTTQQKKDLNEAFWRARLDEEHGVPAVPGDAAPETVGRTAGTYYPEALAWRTYVAYVGQALAVENARWVRWSLLDQNATQLSRLLGSRGLFTWQRSSSRWVVDPGAHGYVTYGDPTRQFRFLRTNDLLRPTTRATGARLVDWSRRLAHFYDSPSAPYANFWGYTGMPPIERILSGWTTRAGEREHWTAGCHGTAGFFHGLLRTANIPVAIAKPDRHSLVHFMVDDLYLSHGDDPYSAVWQARPPFDADELYIDRATFDRWFAPTVPAAQREANVGRQPKELALRNPTADSLLRSRCQDLADGRTPETSRVFRSFQSIYSVAELEARGLWTRIDAEIAARGGCASILAA
jgi:hypothetical protein